MTSSCNVGRFLLVTSQYTYLQVQLLTYVTLHICTLWPNHLFTLKRNFVVEERSEKD